MPKYGSQVIFGRIHHVAESMRHIQSVWDDLSEICRYRNSNTGVCERDPNKVQCHWQHCTVGENTIYHRLGGV